MSIIDPEAGHCLFHVVPKSSSIKKYILLGLKFFESLWVSNTDPTEVSEMNKGSQNLAQKLTYST